jgi:hypothetical protein
MRFIRASHYAQIAQRFQMRSQLRPGESCDIHTDIHCALSSSDPTGLFTDERLSGKLVRFEKSTIAGWGLFAAEEIAASQPIIEYKGEKVREAIVNIREKRNEAKGNNGSYIFRVGPDSYIDATDQGGAARYINHSCDPNCESRTYRFKGETRIVICTLRDIEAGEELTYDYKLPYESLDKAVKCLCGSVKCRGWLNYREDGKRRIAPQSDEESDPFAEPIRSAKYKSPPRKSGQDLEAQKVKMERDRLLLEDIARLIPGIDLNSHELRDLLHITTGAEESKKRRGLVLVESDDETDFEEDEDPPPDSTESDSE